MNDKEYTTREKARIVDRFIEVKVKMVTNNTTTITTAPIKCEKETMIEKKYLLNSGKDTHNNINECLLYNLNSIPLQIKSNKAIYQSFFI